MTILNYQCHKAETTFRGRSYTAWFTIDIPINEGPWKLYGLPGLILKLEDNDLLFSYEAVGLMHNSDKLITMDDDTYTKCTNEQLYKWIEHQRKNVSRTSYSNGVMYVSQRANPITFIKQELTE